MCICKQILIVEDNRDIRETLQLLLEGAGYEVATAEHGADALQCLQAGGKPCLILLDLMMPVMDGWAFMEKLRDSQNGSVIAPIPVIVTSALVGQAELSKFEPIDQLKKPVDFHRLLELVREHCGSPNLPGP